MKPENKRVGQPTDTPICEYAPEDSSSDSSAGVAARPAPPANLFDEPLRWMQIQADRYGRAGNRMVAAAYLQCATKLEELEAQAAARPALARRFPIQQGPSIPWALMVPHERQARENHNQTLERLAERGGLSPCEALAILEDREWHEIPHEQARQQLIEYLAKHEAALARPAWQPISTAPKDWTHLLLWQPGVRVTEGYWDVAANRFRCSHGDQLWEFTPTHWQALPPPPTEEGQR